MEMLRHAFKLGMMSYTAGLDQEDNPYDPKFDDELDLYLSWLDGWVIARSDTLQMV